MDAHASARVAAERGLFAVVIPMYDEERGAEDCVREVSAVISGLPECAALIVVDDGSRDGTGAILAGLAPRFGKLTVVTHEVNLGYGAALRSGVRHAAQLGCEYVLFMDSDLTNDPRDIPRFARKMAEGVDVIKATRYSHGGGIRGVPLHRVLVSRLGNTLARRLYRLPVADCTNGFRAVRTALLTRMDLRENDFSLIMEELFRCKQLARSYANVPVVLTNRSASLRGSAFRYRPSTFYDYLKYPLRSFASVASLRGGAIDMTTPEDG